MTDSARDEHEQAVLRFAHAWGALAHAWGISRSMGEIHALLFVSPEPLSADDIMARLSISRGSANTNLRALEEWRLARRIHKPGDRKDYYVAESDAWSVCWTLLDERKRREVDPMLEVLRDSLGAAPDGDHPAGTLYRERLSSMLELFEALDALYARLRQLSGIEAQELMRAVTEEPLEE